MEKEEDISFRSVLQNVITGLAPAKVLVDHPEFQCRVRRFCKRIDRTGSEDLVWQICLHILQSARLKAADAQDEDRFFRWFFVAAGNHLRARSRDCIEPSKNWPNTTAELAFGELDQFFAHADACPYHKHILLIEGAAEEDKFDSLVHAARGLDPHGVIRSVEHLIAITDDAKERLHVWNEGALARGLLFEYIGLYNAEKRVATVHRFFDVRIHVSTHELDPRAGLQIKAMTDKDPNYEVPLGRCDLIGVRHDNIERHFPLANGYTVGLSIKQHTRTKFTLGFRCVRTDLINQEQADLNKQVDREGGVSDDSSNIDLKPPSQEPAMPAHIPASLLGSSGREVGACIFSLFLVLLLPVLQSLVSREGVAPGPPAKSDVHARPTISDKEIPDEATSQNGARHATKHPANSVNRTSSGLFKAIQHELGKQVTPTAKVSMTHVGPLEWPTSTRVETFPVWQVRVYETTPRPKLLVTHFVDNEKMRDQLEQLLPDPSFRLVVLTDAFYSDLPQTGYEIKWKTIYQHNQLVSVEATVDRLGKNKHASTSIFKEACAMAGCEDWLLSAKAIANVYGYINPTWRSRIISAMTSISQCLFDDVPPSPALRNEFHNTGLSGDTFDEFPNCFQSSAGPLAEEQ